MQTICNEYSLIAFDAALFDQQYYLVLANISQKCYLPLNGDLIIVKHVRLEEEHQSMGNLE